MKSVLLVFVGGGLGSVARYLLGNFVTRIYPHPFPLGTLAVNVAACFLVGVFGGMLLNKDASMRLLLITGFCGGFSTFSTFAAESVKLFHDQLTGQVVINALLSVVLCLLATFLGLWLTGK